MNSQTAERKLSKPEIVSKIFTATEKHQARWERLGGSMIESLNNGQWPRVIAVGPAIVGGLKRLYGEEVGHSGKPGKVFEVTCRKDGTLDEAGVASVFYGVRHLGIKRMEVWGTDLSTQEKTLKQLRAANIEGFGEVDVRTGAISGSRGNDFANAEAGVLTCSDSRVQAYQIFEGSNIVVVSNAGNILSPVAVETFSELVQAGVPVLAVLGHTKCGAVGAALKGNTEPQLQAIIQRIHTSVPIERIGEKQEAMNAIFTATEIKEKGVALIALLLELENGSVKTFGIIDP
jgi:carbonic anhydrase